MRTRTTHRVAQILSIPCQCICWSHRRHRAALHGLNASVYTVRIRADPDPARAPPCILYM